MSLILVVDDEPRIRQVLSVILKRAGYDVRCASSGEEALPLFESERPDVSLVDIRMSGMSGIELLAKIKEIDPSAMALIMTAYSTWEMAVEAMRLGAFNYIKKPFDNDRLRAVIARAIEQKNLLGAGSELTELMTETIIGSSPVMEEVFRMIRSAAPTDMTVLIEGESGTGKELVARALHYGSTRNSGSFIAVNCAAFPETLLESEFFGYTKGAFTGADRDKKGLLDVSDNGTLFIDEIGEMPLTVQAKFLRVLETGEFLPLGSTSMKKVDARLIVSTNRSLEKEVEAGRFRHDLFYRLSVMPIQLHPLRDRKDDIPLLCGHFISRHSARFDKKIKGVAPDAMSILMAHDWPGNVRELENLLEKAIALTETDEISVEDLTRGRDSLLISGSAAGTEQEIEFPIDLESKLEEVETEHIKGALSQTEGNLTRAAELLGISFRSLRYRVKKLGIDTFDHESD